MNREANDLRTNVFLLREWRRLLTRRDAAHIALISVMIGFFFLLYQKLAIPTVPDEIRSTFWWIYLRWVSTQHINANAYSTFGWFIPVTSLVLIWYRRDLLRQAVRSTNWLGLSVVVFAMLLHWMGVKTQHARLSVISMPLVLWGSLLFVCGWPFARTLIFPLGFMVFMIPLNFLNGFMFKIRVLSARITASVMNGLGIECTSQGASIMGTGNSSFVFALQENRIGFRDFILLTIVLAVVAYLTQRTLFRKYVAFLCALPIYLVSNVSVTVFLCLVDQMVEGDLRAWVTDTVMSGVILTAAGLLTMGTTMLLRKTQFPRARVSTVPSLPETRS